MKITKYKVKREDLIDAIIAGIVFMAVVVFFIEKHRREQGCTSCQQQQQGDMEEGIMDIFAATKTHAMQVYTSPLTVDQIRKGVLN